MLDWSHPIHAPGVAGVRLYADLDDDRRVHVVPLHPALARADDGRPELSAMVYRRGGSVTGAHLSVTVELAAPAAEEHLVHAALDRPGSAVVLVPPDWLSATATLTVAERSKRGQPSLVGTNRCAFALALDAPVAAELVRRWPGDLSGATVRYDVVLQAGERQHARARDHAGSRHVALTASTASPLRLTLTGPLATGPDDFAHALHVVDL